MTEAAKVLLNNKRTFKNNVLVSMKGGVVEGVKYDNVMY